MSIRVSRVHDPIRADSHIIIQEQKAGTLKTLPVSQHPDRGGWLGSLRSSSWANRPSSPKMNSSLQTGDLFVILGVDVGKDSILPLAESISDEGGD